jgi:hypothetical protein
VLPSVHTLLGFTASAAAIVAGTGAPGVAGLPFGMLGGASDTGVVPVVITGGGGERRKRKRIEWVPPDRDLETRERVDRPQPTVPHAPSVKLSKAARKLAQAVARARSGDQATAERARAFLETIRANADSDLARLLARQQAFDEHRRGAALVGDQRHRFELAEEEDAVLAMMQWLMRQ